MRTHWLGNVVENDIVKGTKRHCAVLGVFIRRMRRTDIWILREETVELAARSRGESLSVRLTTLWVKTDENSPAGKCGQRYH